MRPLQIPTGAQELYQRLREVFSWDRVGDFVLGLATFLLIVTLGFLLGRAARATYHGFGRTRPSSLQLLMGKLLHFGILLFALGIAFWSVFRLNPVGLFTALGLVSIALGFGLQNTVANLAAGVGLAVDKPFDVGDRIRVGTTWGDVLAIGLRSTRIRTVNGETVVVPNAVMDTQEVWNFTRHGFGHYRLDLPFSITYRSSIALAEHLAMQMARGDEDVLAYPEPAVRVIRFAENGVDLELRAWLREARARPATRDRLLRGIKRSFDREGVLFPFPQRTISRLEELPAPTETPDFLHETHAAKPVVVVCIRDRPIMGMVHRVVQFVDALDARLVVFHVRPPKLAMQNNQAQAAANLYLEEAQVRGVPARAHLEVGELAKELADTVRETGASLVVFGTHQSHRLGLTWHRSDIDAAKRACPVPFVVIDEQQPLDERMVEQWRQRFDEAREQEVPRSAADEASPVGVGGPEEGGGLRERKAEEDKEQDVE